MRTLLFRISVLGLVLALSACAQREPSQPRQRVVRDLITQQDMRAGGFNNAYEAVRALRPQWMTVRGPDSFRNPGRVQVYVNGTRMDGVESLREFGVAEVTYIRYYNAIDATARWGLDHGHGAIYISTRPDGL
jgi:hypothetical protein